MPRRTNNHSKQVPRVRVTDMESPLRHHHPHRQRYSRPEPERSNTQVSFVDNRSTPASDSDSVIMFADFGSRQTTAIEIANISDSVLKHKVSAPFRQAMNDAKESALRSKPRKFSSKKSHSDLALDEEYEDDSEDEIFQDERVKEIERKKHPLSAMEIKSKRARLRWAIIKDKIEEIHQERKAKKTEGWSMFFKHVKAMSEAEKTRQDLYERYGTFNNGKSEFLAEIPTIPEELMKLAEIALNNGLVKKTRATILSEKKIKEKYNLDT